MREQLIGYLLDALDPDERRNFEERLLEDAALRDELERVRGCLELLEEDAGGFEPPAGLAERTCRNVSLQSAPTPASVPPDESRWSLREWITGVSVLAASLFVLFPAISESRFKAGVNECQDKLRGLGFALAQFAENDAERPGCFPYVPPEGNLSFAGLYAPRLMQAGYVEEAGDFTCPEVLLGDPRPRRVPTSEELIYATLAQRSELLRQMEGFFGYTLGVRINGHYQPVRNQGRPGFALLADAPSSWLDGRPGVSHGGRGVNVLYEYGNVRFVHVCPQGEARFNDLFLVYLNDEGRAAAGVHLEDAVVVPVHAGPGIR